MSLFIDVDEATYSIYTVESIDLSISIGML